jgi:hypothetical protein
MSSIKLSVFGECVSARQALCISASVRVGETIQQANKMNNHQEAGKPVAAISPQKDYGKNNTKSGHVKISFDFS